MPSLWGIKALAKWAPQIWQGRPRWSALEPQAALPTSATRMLWGHCEHHNNTHPATTTTIIIAASIAATHVRRDKQEALPQQEASSRSGKCMPLISYDTSIGINENKNANNNNKTMLKNFTINVHHHDNRHHSGNDKSRDDPRKFRRQRWQRERKQELQLLVRQ